MTLDYYLENRSMQPKKDIGDYVEKNGILVPIRYDTLQDARASGENIFARFEHPQDYDGISGMFYSVNLSEFPKIDNVEELKKQVLKRYDCIVATYLDERLKLMNSNFNSFKEEFSYSFWEKIPEYNRMIAADSVIKGKYHVMTRCDIKGKETTDYAVVENGKVEHLIPDAKYKTGSLKETDKKLKELVDIYEEVRNLERFDVNHCPIMEFQLSKGKHYFLQYHRGRDFSAPDFELTRQKEKGEEEALFVRGKTSPEGQTYRIVAHSHDSWYDGKPLPKEEDGFYGKTEEDEIYPELMARKWKLRIIPLVFDLQFTLFDAVRIGHVSRTQLYKPEISLIIDQEKALLSKKENEDDSDDFSYIDVFAISDGRKAYVKRI